MSYRSSSLVCAVLSLGLTLTVRAAQQTTGPATQLQSRLMTVTVGRGQLVQFPDDASRVSVSDPSIADAVVVSPHEVVLNGKSVGQE